MSDRKIRFGQLLFGAGNGTSWRDPRVPFDASVDIDWYIDRARRAEEAKLDFVFITDSQFAGPASSPHNLSRLEPLTLLSAVAVSTSRVGLVATLSSSYNSPFNIARRVASLDHISRGRAAWNVVTSIDEATARNFNRETHFDYETRYRIAGESVDVVRGLWDSYEDDAFVYDVDANVFADVAKQHPLDHAGEFFQVAGPLNLGRVPQGQPVVFQAGSSEEGRDLAGRTAEAIFAPGKDFQTASEYYQDIKRRVRAYGRRDEDIVILPGIGPIVAATDAEARDIAHAIHEAENDFDRKIKQFSRPFGWHDFTQYDLDGAFPQLGDLGDLSSRSRSRAVSAYAAEHGLTLRETVLHFSAPERTDFVGSVDTVVAALVRWFENGAADGFNLHFRTPDLFDAFTQQVLPRLAERGLFRTDYESDTLRGNLGLALPENPHTVARRKVASTVG